VTLSYCFRVLVKSALVHPLSRTRRDVLTWKSINGIRCSAHFLQVQRPQYEIQPGEVWALREVGAVIQPNKRSDEPIILGHELPISFLSSLPLTRPGRPSSQPFPFPSRPLTHARTSPRSPFHVEGVLQISHQIWAYLCFALIQTTVWRFLT
jgi:hypothetical protein